MQTSLYAQLFPTMCLNGLQHLFVIHWNGTTKKPIFLNLWFWTISITMHITSWWDDDIHYMTSFTNFLNRGAIRLTMDNIPITWKMYGLRFRIPNTWSKQFFTSIHTCELLLWVQAQNYEPQLPIETIIFSRIFLASFRKMSLNFFKCF
jgi:hypothetical protein